MITLIGMKSFNMPTLTNAEYIELVDFTGREWHAGMLASAVKLNQLCPEHSVNSGSIEIIGQLALAASVRIIGALWAKAKEMAQRTLGLARILSKIKGIKPYSLRRDSG